MNKLVKPEGAVISAVEKQVSQALGELQSTGNMKAQLTELYFVSAKEVQVGNKTAILIYVPVPMLRQFQKIQVRIVRELEKKFSGKTVIFLAKRRILPKPLRGSKHRVEKQKRPRSRTLTAVHDAWLDEMVFPAEVVGRRIRVKADGKHIHKIHLDKSSETSIEHKVDTISEVYKKMTGKDVVFTFPTPIF